MQHWTLTRDADGLARLTLDRAGASTNTLGAPVLAELNAALDELDRDPPRGLVIASGKANGFIAGADVDEFGQLAERGRRAGAGQARLGHVRASGRRQVSDRRARSAASAWVAGWSSRSPAATAWSSTSRARGSACPR